MNQIQAQAEERRLAQSASEHLMEFSEQRFNSQSEHDPQHRALANDVPYKVEQRRREWRIGRPLLDARRHAIMPCH